LTRQVPITAALARSRLLNTPLSDSAAKAVQDYETGAAVTHKAALAPRSWLNRASRHFTAMKSRFNPNSPDRDASRRRKRKWAGSATLPPAVRSDFTEGERAVLAVVGEQWKRKGLCDLAIDGIAALAGVSRTTVQNALRKARDPSRPLISVEERPQAGRKNLTNVVRILSREWLAWMRRAIGFKKVNASKIEGDKTSNISPSSAAAMALEEGRRGHGTDSQATPSALRVTINQSTRQERPRGSLFSTPST
jgi:hypothetical protein